MYFSMYGVAAHQDDSSLETPFPTAYRERFFFETRFRLMDPHSPLDHHVELLHEAGICERPTSVRHIPDYDRMLSALEEELMMREGMLGESQWDERTFVKTSERIITLLKGFASKIASPKNLSEEMVFHILRSQLRLLESEVQRFKKRTKQT